jgi:hypothetical protein
MLSLQEGLGDNRLVNKTEGWIASEEFVEDNPEGRCLFGS